jgi:hypothetical protein
MATIWDKHPNYTADELRTLVAVAAQVLCDSEEAAGAVPPDLLDLPPAATARALSAELDDATPQAVRAMLDDEDRAQKAALLVLDQLRAQPDLAARIAQAYEARTGKMAVETILLAGALVILAIKLKSFSFTRDGVKATFTESREAVKAFVSGLVRLT